MLCSFNMDDQNIPNVYMQYTLNQGRMEMPTNLGPLQLPVYIFSILPKESVTFSVDVGKVHPSVK